MNVNQDIIFYGVTDKIPEILSAMDIFILPSLFEGLALSLIEAQASGLPVLASDTLALEAKLSDKYHVLPLDDLKAWCDDIWRVATEINKRRIAEDDMIDTDYISRLYPEIELENNKFTIDATVKSIKKVYERLAS